MKIVKKVWQKKLLEKQTGRSLTKSEYLAILRSIQKPTHSNYFKIHQNEKDIR